METASLFQAGPLCGESTGHRSIHLTNSLQCRASMVFSRCSLTLSVEQTIELSVIYSDLRGHMWRHYNACHRNLVHSYEMWKIHPTEKVRPMSPLIIGSVMGLLPDTQICGLRMCRGCWERFPRHSGLAIPTCITTRSWRTCRDACRDR